MTDRIVFLHTVTSLVDLFNQISRRLIPAEIEIMHIVDELLLRVVLRQGGLSPFIHRRVAEHALAAENAGATLLQLTCSSLSPCVDTACSLVSIPVLKIDKPMVEHALTIGDKIGVIATAPTTLKPTTDLVYSTAHFQARKVQVQSILCQDAYTALFAGDQQTHDTIIRNNIFDLSKKVDVIILAQASMARVLTTFHLGELTIPVLTSPELAVERLRQYLTG